MDTCKILGPCLGVGAVWLYDGKGPKEREKAIMATPSELIFAAVEEAFLLAKIAPDVSQSIAGVIQLVLDAHPSAPRGMSQQEAVRRLVRLQLADILPPEGPKSP
jgi:hypothetical protein